MGALIHDPLTRLLAQIAAIVVTSFALNLLARRIGQPRVIAEVTAGILLGPSLLGWLAPETSAALFPPESLGPLQLVSQLGMVLFMFIVGLELDPAVLRERPHQSVVISHTSIVVPFLLGAGIAVPLHPILAEPSVALLPFSLFLGVAMSTTAFPVLARILAERRLTQTPLGSLAIACAAVDDVTAWCILAFVVAAARATAFSGAIATTALTIAYIATLVWVVRPLLQRVAHRLGTPEGLTQGAVSGLLLMLLLSSWATELIGVHALFGAFLFGAILPKQGNLARNLAAKVEDLVLAILLPLFFAYSGVRTQLGLLDTPADWGICALLIGVACLGKFGAGTLAARITGLAWRDAGALGILMNTRGLMELIVLNIGLDLGVIGPTVFTMMVLMALVTTFATTPLLHWMMPTSAPAPRAVPRAVAASAVPDLALMLCIADERIGPAMAALASAITGTRSRVQAVHLIEPSDRGSFLMDPEQHLGGPALGPLLQRAQELSLPVRPLAFVSTEPARDLCDLARAQQTDLVLLGLHRPLLGPARLGGTVYSVLSGAGCDVAVLIDRGLVEVRRVLVPFLGVSRDRAALRLARRLLQHGAEVTALHVVSPGSRPLEVPPAELLDAGSQVKLQSVEHASPPLALFEAAHSGGYDLVCVGLATTWGLEDRPMQAERLLTEAKTSLLIVRGRGESTS